MSGLARWEKPLGTIHRIDEWLVQSLLEINASSLVFWDLVPRLQLRLAAFSKGLLALGQDRMLNLTMAGFGPAGPFLVLLSNFEDETGARLDRVDDGFRRMHLRRGLEPLRRLDLVVTGAERAFDACEDVAEKVRKKYKAADPDHTANVLVELVRQSADHPSMGSLIGTACLSTVVSPQGGVHVQRPPSRRVPAVARSTPHSPWRRPHGRRGLVR